MDGLLAPDEGAAVEVRVGPGPFVVVCEHASNRMPRALGTLGLSVADLERHIAWDPGAAGVANGLNARLGGDLVLQRFSRLVVDCNRSPELPDAIAPRSEDTVIPGNVGLSFDDRGWRIATLWVPFHAAIERVLERRVAIRQPTALVTVHSFTPVYRGVWRPWHVGIISSTDRRMAEMMLAVLRRDSSLVVGDDEPYSAKDNVDYTIRRHGRNRGLPHVMIEVRNDLLASPEDVEAWADRLAGALHECAEAIDLMSAPAGAAASA